MDDPFGFMVLECETTASQKQILSHSPFAGQVIDDSFSGDDDDGAWPESSCGEHPDDVLDDAVKITFCSVPLTPENGVVGGGDAAELGFSGERKRGVERSSQSLPAKKVKRDGGFVVVSCSEGEDELENPATAEIGGDTVVIEEEAVVEKGGVIATEELNLGDDDEDVIEVVIEEKMKKDAVFDTNDAVEDVIEVAKTMESAVLDANNVVEGELENTKTTESAVCDKNGVVEGEIDTNDVVERENEDKRKGVVDANDVVEEEIGDKKKKGAVIDTQELTAERDGKNNVAGEKEKGKAGRFERWSKRKQELSGGEMANCLIKLLEFMNESENGKRKEDENVDFLETAIKRGWTFPRPRRLDEM